MTPFPLTIAGRLLANMDDLVALLGARGRHNITDNPAHLAPAEGLIDDSRDPIKAAAMAHACAVLIGRSDDPGVLQLCAHVGASGHEVFYRAVVDRLDGDRPIPDAAGMSEPTLIDEFANTLSRPEFGRFPALHRRAVNALLRLGAFRSAVYVLSTSDPNNVCATVLIDVLVNEPIDDRLRTVIGLAVNRMARERSGRLLDVATALAGTPIDVRELCAKRAEQGNAEWWSLHGDNFRARANLA